MSCTHCPPLIPIPPVLLCHSHSLAITRSHDHNSCCNSNDRDWTPAAWDQTYAPLYMVLQYIFFTGIVEVLCIVNSTLGSLTAAAYVCQSSELIHSLNYDFCFQPLKFFCIFVICSEPKCYVHCFNTAIVLQATDALSIDNANELIWIKCWY